MRGEFTGAIAKLSVSQLVSPNSSSGANLLYKQSPWFFAAIFLDVHAPLACVAMLQPAGADVARHVLKKPQALGSPSCPAATPGPMPSLLLTTHVQSAPMENEVTRRWCRSCLVKLDLPGGGVNAAVY